MEQDTTTFTVISTETMPALHEGWPYPDRYITSAIEGTLARQIRRRFGLAPDGGVIMVERQISGGYSEYTQEMSYKFSVSVGNHYQSFDSDTRNAVALLLEWVGEGPEEQGVDLEGLPVGSMVRVSREDWVEDSVVVRCEDGGGASTGRFSFLGGRHWLGIADWGADVEVLYRAEAE